MTGQVVLALDVGTSAVKAVVADADGRIRASRQRSYGLRTPAPGWVEQDVGEICSAISDACRALVADGALIPSNLASIGVTAQMFNLVPVDDDGQPLCPMLSWLDQRAAGVAASLADRLDADAQYRVFGSVMTAKDIVPRILWLRDEQPDVFGRTVRLLDCKETIVAWLTGRAVIDPAGASAFRLFDLVGQGWDPERCAVVGVPPALLPEVHPSTAIAGRLTTRAAAATGLPVGVPVVVGAGDVVASQLGAGATEPGEIHLSLGTAVYFGITVAGPVDDPGRRMGVIGHAAPDRAILWLEIATGGGALAWLLRLLDEDGTFDEVERLVEGADGETDDLLFAPWLTGERVPLFDDSARAAFVGLTLRHGRGHLIRAVMEGVACQIRWAYEYASGYGIPLGTIRAVGGGSIGETWTQIIADTLGRPLEIVREPQDAAALGAAACALVGLNIQTDLAFVRGRVEVDRVVMPDPAQSLRSNVRFERFRGLHAALGAVLAP